MNQNKFNAFYFYKNDQHNQVYDFLKSMNFNILTKTIQQMKLLEQYGIEPGYVSIKKFQNGIWKIRTKDVSNNVRLFFYIIDNNIYYLYGFMKKTQKTPEGKKITINNLKILLLNAIKQNRLSEHIKPINYNELI